MVLGQGCCEYVFGCILLLCQKCILICFRVSKEGNFLTAIGRISRFGAVSTNNDSLLNAFELISDLKVICTLS